MIIAVAIIKYKTILLTSIAEDIAKSFNIFFIGNSFLCLNFTVSNVTNNSFIPENGL